MAAKLPEPFCSQPNSASNPLSHADTKPVHFLVVRTATTRSPLPVQSHSNPRGSKMAAVFAEQVLCLAAQLPLQLCTHHAPPSPALSNPRGTKMAAVFAEPVLCLTAQLPLQLCSHHAPVLFLSVIIALILNLEWKKNKNFLY
jgi:hypothetical protein